MAIQRYVFHIYLAFFSSLNVKYGNVYVTSDIPWRHKYRKTQKMKIIVTCDVTSHRPLDMPSEGVAYSISTRSSYILTMEAVCPPETSANFYQVTRRHIPEGSRQASWLTATDVGRRNVSRGALSHGSLSCN